MVVRDGMRAPSCMSRTPRDAARTSYYLHAVGMSTAEVFPAVILTVALGGQMPDEQIESGRQREPILPVRGDGHRGHLGGWWRHSDGVRRTERDHRPRGELGRSSGERKPRTRFDSPGHHAITARRTNHLRRGGMRRARA